MTTRAWEEALWQLDVPSPVTLELCRLRIARLVGARSELARRTPEALAAGLTEAQVRGLGWWPTDPAISEEQRVALALAEQVTMDPHGVDDAHIAEARALLGDAGLVALMVALAVFEGTSRAAAILGAAPEAAEAGVQGG